MNALTRHIVQEVSYFFDVYKALEHSKTSVKETGSRDQATNVVRAAIAHYQQTFGEDQAGP